MDKINLKPRYDDDFADRLIYKTTVGIFVLFAGIIGTKQFVGHPIQCWVPPELIDNKEYINNNCWATNTYLIEAGNLKVIPYYQLAPFILVAQALICYLPIIIWRYLSSMSGIDVNAIVEAGEKFTSAENRDKTLNFMCQLMDRYLTIQRDMPDACTSSIRWILSRTCFKWCGRRQGNCLITLYLFTKFFLLISVIIQFFLLDLFLGQDFHMYGFDTISRMFKGEAQVSERFPSVTMCDLNVEKLNVTLRYTVQCVLSINLCNKKIYLFVWFWLALVTIIMTVSVISWLIRIISSYDRRTYIMKHLFLMGKMRNSGSRLVAKFVITYLRQDGIFVLRMVGHNINAITETEFVCKLWDYFEAKQPPVDSMEVGDLD